MLRMLIIILSLSSAPALSSPFSAPASFYQKGEFAQAAELYESMLNEDFVNGSILFNLGNAYYKDGQMGAAMAAYLRAYQLRPRDPDIKSNLAFLFRKLGVQGQENSKLLKPSLSMSDLLSDLELFQLMVMASVILGILMAIQIHLPRFRKGLWPLTIASSLILLLGAGAGVIRYQNYHPIGAVTSPQVEAFGGPSDKNSLVLFEISEGTPLWKLRNIGDWVEIELADGKRAWVHQQQLRFF